MASIDDGLVDSPFGRVSPEILDILKGGQGSPQAPQEPAPVVEYAAPEAAPVADPNSVSSHFGRGVDRLQAAGGGTLEAMGEAFGSPSLAQTGADIRQEQLDQASQYGTPEYASAFDVDIDNPESIGEYLKGVVTGAAPALGATMAGGAAGSKIGAAFGPAGRVAGGLAGAFAASFGINAGEFQNEVKALDPTKQGGWSSLAFGAGAGALDTFALGKLVSPLMKWVPEGEIFKRGVQAGFSPVEMRSAILLAGAGFGKGVITEGATEGLQELGQAWGASKVADHVLDEDKLWERVVDASIGGGLVGGAVRSGTGIIDTVMQNAHAVDSAHVPTPSQGKTKEGGFWTKLWQLGGSAATESLQPLANVSPEAKSLVEEFRPDMTGKSASSKTMFEDADIKAGTWNEKLNEVIEGKSDAEVSQLIAEASQPKDNLSGEALKFRTILDEVPEVAKTEGGLSNIGYIEGFMPFRVDEAKVQAAPQEFLADIAPFVKDPQAAIDNWIKEINTPRGSQVPEINQLVKPDTTTGELEIMQRYTKGGDPNTMRPKFAQGDATPKFGHLEFSRSFGEVPQAVLNKWVKEQTPKQQVEAVRDYFEGAAHRISLASRFGENGEKFNARLAKAVYEAQQAGRPVSKGEIDKAYGLYNAYNGMHHRIKNEAVKNAQSVFSTFLTIKTLPLAALSSLFEFVTPAIRGDVAHALTAAAPAWAEIAREASRTLLKGVPKSDFAKVASEAGLSFHSAQSVMAERLGATLFNKTAAKLTRQFFLYNGLSLLTHVNRTYAAKTGDQIFHDNLMKLAAGVPITSAKGAQMLAQLRSMGVDIRSQQDAIDLYSPSNPSQVDAAREARVLAIHRFTRQAVLEPNAADTPLWQSDGRMQLVAMLKRYPSAFSNTILPQMARKLSPTYQGSYSNAAASAIGLAFILGAGIAIGYLQDELKQITKSGALEYEDNRTELQRFADVLNTTLMPMQMQYVTDMFSAQRYGSSPIETIAGPAAGFLKETATAGSRTIGSFAEEPTSGYIWQYLYKQTPARVFKPASEAIKEEFDLP
jgi:hypothetical protein